MARWAGARHERAFVLDTVEVLGVGQVRSQTFDAHLDLDFSVGKRLEADPTRGVCIVGDTIEAVGVATHLAETRCEDWSNLGDIRLEARLFRGQ
jgi:hypothetical protein